MRIQHENIVIESSIPIAHMLTLHMNHKLNEHGTLNMKAVIQPEMHHAFLHGNYLGQNIQFSVELDSERHLIFSGKVNGVAYEQQADVLTTTIDAISYSVELDNQMMRRSFQQTDISFRALLDLVIEGTNARFSWQVGGDKKLEKPFIQYNETDWEFIKRLASYFERPIHVSLLSERADLYFGVRSGVRQHIDEATILEVGISEAYYQNGGYEKNVPRERYYYLKVKHREPWQLGDFAMDRNRKLTVIHTQAFFEQGELTFAHLLGAEGYVQQQTIYASHLAGLSLQGVIRKTEKESLTIQLDIDHDEQAHYLWRWMPEVGNLNYLMPEIGSRVALTFPTNDEKDAYGVHLLRTNTNSGVLERIENKEFVTAADKTIGLYPSQLFLAGKNHDVKLNLEDGEGIRLNSHTNIRMIASGEIQLKGKQVTVVAPDQVLMQTSRSNIDVATNFNLFAPKGVNTVSERPHDPSVRHQAIDKKTNPNQLPLAYGAMGAMPKSLGVNANQNELVNAATSAMPRITGGQTAVAINEVMNGTHATPSTRSFSSMGSFSMKGGSRVPVDETEN